MALTGLTEMIQRMLAMRDEQATPAPQPASPAPAQRPMAQHPAYGGGYNPFGMGLAADLQQTGFKRFDGGGQQPQQMPYQQPQQMSQQMPYQQPIAQAQQQAQNGPWGMPPEMWQGLQQNQPQQQEPNYFEDAWSAAFG